MRRHKKRAVGIDLCERYMSLALVEKACDGPRIVSGLTAALPHWESPEWARAAAQTLRRFGRRAGVRGASAAIALSGGPTVMQILDLPVPIPANVGTFVERELKQYVPLSGKDPLSDFCGIGIGSCPQRQLLTVSADRASVHRAVAACDQGGMAVEAVEPAVLAYARAHFAARKGGGSGGGKVLALLGRRDLVVCLFRAGMLAFVRVRPLPSDAATPEPQCRWLATELRLIGQYCHAQALSDDESWTGRVMVQGNPCAAHDIAALLGLETGMESIVVIDACDVSGQSAAAVAAVSEQPPSIVAFGAALKLLEAGTDEFRVNLLPREVTKTRAAYKLAMGAAMVAGLVLLNSLLASQFLARAAGDLDEKINQTRLAPQLYRAPAWIARKKVAEESLSAADEQLQRLHVAWARHEVDWAAVLDAVERARPSDVRVTRLTCGDSRILCLVGSTLSPQAAETFVQELGRSLFVASASLSRIERRPDDHAVMEYEIVCELRVTSRQDHGGQTSEW